VLGYLDHLLITRAAFRAAVEQYPNARIRLRTRVLVMEEYKPK
jgi:mRNA-degrading endonuclease HigB of HigAB toxin-antitoxin module